MPAPWWLFRRSTYPTDSFGRQIASSSDCDKVYWVLKGELFDRFDGPVMQDISKELKEFANVQENGEEDFEITFTPYMMAPKGKSKSHARPTILVISKDEEQRQLVRDRLRMQLRRRYPEFRIASVRIDPCCPGDLEELAGTAKFNVSSAVRNLVTQVYFDPTCPIQGSTFRIYVRKGSSVRMAVANAVQITGRIYIQTVYHVFVPERDGSEESNTIMGMATRVDSDSESEFSVDTEVSDSAGTARHLWDTIGSQNTYSGPSARFTHAHDTSDSSAFTARSASIFDRPEIVAEVITTPNLNSTLPTTLSHPLSDSVSMSPEYPDVSVDSLVPLGNLLTASIDKDWALVEIANVQAVTSLEACFSTREQILPYNSISQRTEDDVLITAHTCRGDIAGTLLSTPSYTRLPKSRTLQKIYTVRLAARLQKGDCGSTITDPSTKAVYGYLVAGCRHTGAARIIPATSLLEDFELVSQGLYDDPIPILRSEQRATPGRFTKPTMSAKQLSTKRSSVLPRPQKHSSQKLSQFRDNTPSTTDLGGFLKNQGGIIRHVIQTIRVRKENKRIDKDGQKRTWKNLWTKHNVKQDVEKETSSEHPESLYGRTESVESSAAESLASYSTPPTSVTNLSIIELRDKADQTEVYHPRSQIHRQYLHNDHDRSISDIVEEPASYQDILRAARIPCARKYNSKFFIPENRLLEITEPDVLLPVLRKALPLEIETRLNGIASRISTSARRLFATLAYIQKESEITDFFAEGISDNDFPFELRDPHIGYMLQARGGRHIRCISRWEDRVSESFYQCQWWTKAPVFLEGQHYDFHDNVMLPFVDRTPLNIDRGGFSMVYGVEIHPSHHNFSGIKPSKGQHGHVAIKELTAINAEDAEETFLNETKFFKILAAKRKGYPHPHLINLLATYRWKNKYHIMLPRAKGNLYQLWEEMKPIGDLKTIDWCLKQMTGIVNGLLQIHGCEVADLSHTKSSERVESDEIAIKLGKGEEKYGRHGDLKPANILWFVEDDSKWGVLKIADYGLGRFHGRETRSGIDSANVLFSPTYEPPELTLRKHVSRECDMWCLGCVLLEFASWMLKGKNSTNDFAVARIKTDINLSYIGLRNDKYFSVLDKTRTKAVVRHGVVEWVQQLHSHRMCSKFVHDLLDLIMQRLLVIDQDQRFNAVELDLAFRAFLEKAKEDPDYLIKAVPHSTTTTRDQLTLAPPSSGQYQAIQTTRTDMQISNLRAIHQSRRGTATTRRYTQTATQVQLRRSSWPLQGISGPL